MYDCTNDVIEHQENVRKFLLQVIEELVKRQVLHDESKLREPEKSIFDEYTPKLRELTYGSEEYEECRKQMGVALQHHYEHNRHHPEHFEWGVSEMTLVDLIEMLADWKAATLRHADGNIRKSLHINTERFNIEDQLYNVLANTIKDFNW